MYSPGARPDVRIKKRGRVYQLLEVKVLCPISSNADRTDFNGTYAAFANTAPAKRSEIAEKYAPAKTNGHTVVPCVFEVFGGAVPETTRLLGEWSKQGRTRRDAAGRGAAVVGPKLRPVLVAAPVQRGPAWRRPRNPRSC